MIADDFAQLVAHVLAHVPLDRPGNLHDPRYLAWARVRTSPADRAILEHDAAVLARCWQVDRSLDLLHGSCRLHRSLHAFARTVGRALAELDPGEVEDPELLASLRGQPAAELLHATLALVAPGFVSVLAEIRAELERGRAELGAALERIAGRVPGLADARVEVVWALGVHGRALGDRILVGAPSDWSGCSPDRQAILAAHEHLVATSEHRDYVGGEWDALTRLAACLHGSSPNAAHVEWLGSLDLIGLTTAAVERGWLEPERAEAIERRPSERARLLAHSR